MELLHIAGPIFLVPGSNRGHFPFSHSVYVDAERKVLFDAGVGTEVLRQLLSENQVHIIIASHSHADHTSGCGRLAARIPVFVPEEGAADFGNLDRIAARAYQGAEEQALFKNLASRIMGYTDCPAFRTYNSRTAFDLGSVKLVAIHTPGHSKDHYCFFEETTSCMMLFDIDLAPDGPRYGELESSLDRYEASLNLLRSYQPELAFSSHMGILRSNVEGALVKQLEQLSARDGKLLEILKVPMSVDEVAETLPFSICTHERLLPLYLARERMMIRKHADRLVAMGELMPVGQSFVRR